MNTRSLSLLRFTGASLLAFLAACGGRYDIGDGAAGAAGLSVGAGGGSTTGGSGGTDAAGSVGGSDLGTGGSNIGAGGSVAAGGSDPGTGVAGSAGMSAPGTAGFAGTDATGGTAGTAPGGPTIDEAICGARPVPLDLSTTASPMTVWARLDRLLEDDAAAPLPTDLPDETTASWATEVTAARLTAARENHAFPSGFARFMRSWLATNGDTHAEATADGSGSLFNMEGATLATLIAPLTLPGGRAGGLLSDPALNRLRPSISGRGAWIMSALFCVDVGAPPPGSSSVPQPTGVTRRQALEQTVSSAACVGCHRVIDPPGYSLEGIDPLTGEPRSTDNGLPIDTSGTFSAGNTTFTFAGMEDLAPQLATSCDVARCFVDSFTADATTAAGLEPLRADEKEYVLHEYLTHGQELSAIVLALVQTPTFLE